ncbi:MAG: glycosyltransferase family 9 protein [Candidatus Omnitrophica bacterium]|nr:glycosyltransferase family 9 protein [Candidatus Omnitrophota bacterium]
MHKILLIRTDRFGEFILNLPAFRAVRKEFPNSHIAVMAQPYIRELIEDNPDINEVIDYELENQKGIWPGLKLIRFLRKKKFDLAIIFNPQKKFNIITFLAGIPTRVGYERKWGFLLTHKIKDKKYLGEKHEIEYNLDLVRVVTRSTLHAPRYTLKDKNPFIPVKKEDEEFIEKKLRDLYFHPGGGSGEGEILIAIHPWTSNPQKQWPIANFVELADKISQWEKTRVVIIGGKDERKLSQKYFADINAIDFSGEFNLRQTAALLKRCKLLVSCDSGPAHLAAAVGTSVLALFRSGIPGVGAKRWGPWGKGHIVIEKENLEQISVEEVLKAVRQNLKSS